MSLVSKNDLCQALDAGLSIPTLRSSEELAPYGRDFCGVRSGTPLTVARTVSEADVLHAMNAARQRKVRTAIRGAGHTCNGQTLVDGGLVIRCFEDTADVQFDPQTGLADVAARSRWLDVRNHLATLGRAVPVLTDYLHLSVGGTLSVGGYGARSIVQGAQIDNVDHIRLLLHDGRAVVCSREGHRDLFRFALAGQGAAGVIERAVIRTIPHRHVARFYAYDHGNLSHLAESLAWIEAWDGPGPDLFVGARRLRPGPEFTVSQYGFDLDPRLPLDSCALTPLATRRPSWVKLVEDHELMSHARTVDLVEDHPSSVRLWADYMFGYDGFVEFSRYVDTLLKESRIRKHLTVIGVLIHRSPPGKIDFPFEPSRSTLGKLKYMVGFYFFVPEREPGEIEQVKQLLGDLLERALSFGGRPYLYAYADLSDSQRRALYGTSDEELATILAGPE